MEPAISLAEGRFARFAAIKWWDQSLLRKAKVMVVGAGALGNEVIKNLALLGVGNLLVVDMDIIEESNLCRSVLFRKADEGKSKAEAACRAARDIYGEMQCTSIVGNLLSDVGLGHFRWADVVVGALDNREARVFVNSACARTGRGWIDGGIDVLTGIVRGFGPPQKACYECTMGQADWDLLAKRRSCSLLARQSFKEGGTPTTPTTASVIGAMQAQEVVKRLHGMQCLEGSGFVFEGLAHSSYAVQYPVSPECPWHDEPAPVYDRNDMTISTPLRQVRDWAVSQLGGLDAIDLSREILEELACPACGRRQQVLTPVGRLSPDMVMCEKCKVERSPRFIHSLQENSNLLEKSAAEIGLPARDIVWARCGQKCLGIELT